MHQKSKQSYSRRDFLNKLGLSTVTLGGATMLGPRVLAANGVLLQSDIAKIAGTSNLTLGSTPSAMLIPPVGDNYYYIKSNGLPDHPTGAFPVFGPTKGSGCPFGILPQVHNFRITKRPSINNSLIPLNGCLFGVAVNGVVFDPTGPSFMGCDDTNLRYEVLSKAGRMHLGIDQNNAHTQPGGEYHYHGMPVGLYERLKELREVRGSKAKMILLGYAADGFPVYGPEAPINPMDPNSNVVVMKPSYVLKTGSRPATVQGHDVDNGNRLTTFRLGGQYQTDGGTLVQDFEFQAGSGDLDECNGRFGITPEYPQGIYHYFLTEAFPFIPRYWKGTPDSSFYHPMPPQGRGGGAVPQALISLTLT